MTRRVSTLRRSRGCVSRVSGEAGTEDGEALQTAGARDNAVEDTTGANMWYTDLKNLEHFLEVVDPIALEKIW